jgi:hypothetical protein
MCPLASNYRPSVDRLQARVAELEADQKRHLESIAGEARCLGQLRTDLDTERSRIARAVAELELHAGEGADPSECIDRGLAILKGQP